MKILRLAALTAAATLFAIAAVACGDDDDDDDTNGAGDEPLPTATRSTAASPTSGAATQPAGGSGADKVTVTAADFSFSPAEFAVSGASDTEIELTNSGSAPHTLTIYKDEEFSEAMDGATTDRVSGGDSESFTLGSSDIGDATELYFRCEVHPSQMQGEITVE